MVHPNDKAVTDARGIITYNTETQAEIHLSHLTVDNLRDLARNEAASVEWRKAAVALLLEKKHPYVHHPELEAFVFELQAEKASKVEASPVTEQPASMPVFQTTELTTTTALTSPVQVVDSFTEKSGSVVTVGSEALPNASPASWKQPAEKSKASTESK